MVRVYVNERDLGKIYNGMDANVTTDTNKNERFTVQSDIYPP